MDHWRVFFACVCVCDQYWDIEWMRVKFASSSSSSKTFEVNTHTHTQSRKVLNVEAIGDREKLTGRIIRNVTRLSSLSWNWHLIIELHFDYQLFTCFAFVDFVEEKSLLAWICRSFLCHYLFPTFFSLSLSTVLHFIVSLAAINLMEITGPFPPIISSSPAAAAAAMNATRIL